MVKTAEAHPPKSVGDQGEELFLAPDEGRRQFDAAVRHRMGISGAEFIRRYEAGEYFGLADQEGSRYIGELIMLIPFARQDG